MDILAELKKSPGFVYQISSNYYFLGKFICKPCNDLEITDAHMMYEMCSSAGELQNAAYYYNKLRAYSDFALEPPFHASKHLADLTSLINSLSPFEKQSLEKQYLRFAKDCGFI